MLRLALKIAIWAAGKSQRQVGVECGIPENRMSDFVQGWRDPRPEERERLARALSCSEDRLFRSDAEISAPNERRKGEPHHVSQDTPTR